MSTAKARALALQRWLEGPFRHKYETTWWLPALCWAIFLGVLFACLLVWGLG